MSTSYPAGTTYSYSPGHPAGVVVPPSGMPAAPASDLVFVGKATSFLNDAYSNQMDVFTFHNNVKDALVNGSLSKYDLSSVGGMIDTLPSDWKSMYAATPGGLDNMLQNINGLVNLSHIMWADQPSPLGPTSSWSLQSVDSYNDHIKNSQAQNQGTEKEGMADHPDYSNVNHMQASGGDGDNNILGDLALSYGAAKGGAKAIRAGAGLLGDSEAAASVGEASMLGAEMAVGEGVAVGTAEAIGVASGVGLIAAGAVGLAIAGYEVYKAFGGTGKVPLLDKIGHAFTSFF